ncbi:innexin inx2 isoform X1 [Eurytemora carolleeae]|uniref:innexin inx2 isoform X1 n=1 Tax=Eurytemora carolleeae TaxID=1294199 RepID=UPI000C7855E2|nr:innexin inx2 isoform X1 [Eurytemora carolleeae]|eukprot:XP_023346114.1 innexin inx2-like isoform X1 [Eurytemora affinis]
MKNLKQELDNPVLEEEKREKMLKKLVAYLTVSRVSHKLYGRGYIYSYIAAILNSILQIYLTSMFLNISFEEFTDLAFSRDSRQSTRIFPKMSKCTFYKFGPSGGMVNLDAVCLLPLNILNEKMYIFLYFWMLALLTANIISFFYYSLHWAFPVIRLRHLQYHLKGRLKGPCLKKINRQFGDWWLLHLLHKNIDSLGYEAWIWLQVWGTRPGFGFKSGVRGLDLASSLGYEAWIWLQVGRRTFQELVSKLCDPEQTSKLKKNLTFIAQDPQTYDTVRNEDDLIAKLNEDDINKERGEDDLIEEQGQFFLPGNSKFRRTTVTFQNV